MTRAEWDRLLQKYVDKDERELIYIARSSADNIYEMLKYGGYRARAKELFLKIFTSFAVVDGNVTSNEFELFQTITNDLFDDYYSYEDFKYYAQKNWNSNYLNELEYALHYDNRLKDEIVDMGLAICAIDEHISSAEANFIIEVEEF